MTDKRDPYRDQVIAAAMHQEELRQRREAWEEQKKQEAQEAERAQKRARLEAHLAERARTYFDHTGTTPSTSVLESWQQQYIDQQELARQAEREAQIAATEEEHYTW